MKTITITEPINLRVVKFELDFSSLYDYQPRHRKKSKAINVPHINCNKKQNEIPNPPEIQCKQKKQNVKELVEELLNDIYADHRDWTTISGHGSTAASFTSSQSNCGEQSDFIEISYLESLEINELKEQVVEWKRCLQVAGERLAKCLRLRDRLHRQQKKLCAAFTVLLRHLTGDANIRFGVTPGSEAPGEGGFTEWLHAMRLVARLPAGVPQHFRRKLWLTLAERHLTARGVDWPAAERACFRGTAQPDDTELSAQILKDLHRTGCSLFCGVEGRENQAMLRRVLLAYARWNKDVGYCQGFNMLAAIILEVMDKSESDSLKVMIYLVEAVLPEGYFADDLRGLSADMAAFRDLLRLRLPRLAQHMDHLQRISDGGGVEPPLPDVFTMQWFLTLYATWLPRESLLRIWDLILLDGNEVLLLTALAIWDMLQDRILSARSADEFYSCMGGGVGAVWEAGESLVVRVVAFNSVPELPRLRSLHRYRVTPPAPPNAPPVFHPPLQSAMQSMTKRGLRLFYSEDEGESSDEGNKMALATVATRREQRPGAGDRLSLDIGALKRQYARLRERQRQAHVILAAACARHAAVGVPTSPTSLTVNNLLLGKSAIVSSRGRRLGPPPGAVPPSRQTTNSNEKFERYSRRSSNDTISWEEEKTRKTLNRRNSVKWKDIKKDTALEFARKPSIDLDESGDGVIVSEIEANQMIASMRSRSSSETSSYSSRSESSTDTSLCDENEKASDSETDLPNDDKENNINSTKNKINLPTNSPPLYIEKQNNVLPSTKDTSILPSPTSNQKPSSDDKSVKNITDYLGSAAGEPLRVYIDGFEMKLKDTQMVNNDSKPYTVVSPLKPVHSPQIDVESNNSFKHLQYEHRNNKRNTNLLKSKNKIHLSPIDLSPHNCVRKFHAPTKNHSKLETVSSNKRDEVSYTTPDIIDTFASYPNFVPDIDLSDKYMSDPESPLRSPESESLIVSEDEPPIPLKVDKYFEHSPEFFGARLTDPHSSNIPSRRATKRNSRLPKKPDSLTHNNGKNVKNEAERASSLPQPHTFVCKKSVSPEVKEDKKEGHKLRKKSLQHTEYLEKDFQKPIIEDIPIDKVNESPPCVKEYVLRSGRKNSERALQIIQENSQILSRILTKQSSSATAKEKETIDTTKNKVGEDDVTPTNTSKKFTDFSLVKDSAAKLNLLKESTSDSLIGCLRRSSKSEPEDKNDFLRERPISIDDPFSFEIRNVLTSNDEFDIKNLKTPSIECLVNKPDYYGWENKGFLAKCDFRSNLNRQEISEDEYKRRTDTICNDSHHSIRNQNNLKGDWSSSSFSEESKISVTLPSSEMKDTSSFDRRYTSEDYNYPMTNSSKYNDFVISKASDICSKIIDRSPKISDNLIKTENSQFSDFSHKVTSSISFTCEPSMEDDSPMGAKSNSSDTLCQITSLDQISTPISPKTFPNRDTPNLPKDSTEKSDTVKLESDDTCSAITSLLETDTLSSLSYPRSPSTGSYHPFPTRPAIRLPKDLGIKLGMYPKETFPSPQK